MQKIGIISGSHRHDSQTSKVALYFKYVLETLANQIFLLDLGQNPLPLWDEGVWENSEKWQDSWEPISAELKNCDGYIVISPEWNGMATPAIKNFFLLVSDKSMSNKPTMLATVSSGRGGAYPIAELRSFSYKNTGIVYLPEHIIVRDVKTMLNDFKTEENAPDSYLKGRIEYACKLLIEYSKVLKPVSTSGLVNYEKYSFGM